MMKRPLISSEPGHAGEQRQRDDDQHGLQGSLHAIMIAADLEVGKRGTDAPGLKGRSL